MIYLDNAATTRIHPQVLATYSQVAQEFFANPSSAHGLGRKSRQLLEQARVQVGQLLCYHPQEIYFTSSGTEANNWVFQRIVTQAHKRRPEGKLVLVSPIEHPAVLRQRDYIESQGLTWVTLPVTDQGQVDLGAFQAMLGPEVLLVSTMAVNNEMGASQPLDQMAQILADYPDIIWHVDGVQAVTTELSRIQQPRIDCLSLSSHKFHAPRGVGILACRQRVDLVPLITGGGQEQGQRSGTENLAAIVATAKALRLAQSEQAQTRSRLKAYRQRLTQALEAQGWVVFAQESAASHILCAALPGIPGEVLLNAFEAQNIYVSTTSACSSRVKSDHHSLAAMGVPQNLAQSALRFSLAADTSDQDIENCLVAIAKISQQFEKTRGKS